MISNEHWYFPSLFQTKSTIRTLRRQHSHPSEKTPSTPVQLFSSVLIPGRFRGSNDESEILFPIPSTGRERPTRLGGESSRSRNPRMASQSPNRTFKLVLLGDGRVGKTSLVLRYVNNVFSDKQEATVQAAYLTKRLVIEGVPITLAVWDTAGQERFHALGPIYYRDADAALLVYDITDKDTFVRVRNWVKELQQMASKNIIMAIAANKSDLIRSKKFDLQEAESYAASIGSRHFVTSAKFGTGIDEIFLHIATSLVQLKKEDGEFSVTPARKGMLIVDDEPQKEPQPKCCT